MANIGVTFDLQINNDFVSDIKRNIQVSSAKAAFVVASSLKSRGRADIRASTKGLANAFRVDVYEDKKKSGFPKIFARVRTGYSKVFEEGAVISGKPFLWIPLPAARKMMGRTQLTPAQFNKRYGSYGVRGKRKSNRLFLLKDTERPVLAGLYAVGQRRITKGGRQGWETRRSIKRFTLKSTKFEMQPLYVGIRTSKITARWHLRAIAASEFAKLPALIKRL